MGLFTVDQTKCKKDGICVGECPMAILKLSDNDGFPAMISIGEQICNDCGHCVAVCPHGAITHAHVPAEQSPLIEKELEISEEQAIQFLRKRRSIRFFKKQPVEKEKLRKLIEIASHAPTGGNMQLVEWLVITDADKIKEISGLIVEWMRKILKTGAPVPPYFPRIVGAWDMGYNSVLWSAPAVVIASAPKTTTTGMIDVTLALSYFELAAQKMGFGTCWAGLLSGSLQSSSAVREAVQLPQEHPYFYSMMVGYSKVKYTRLPARRTPKITWR
ncbi:MAG: ferridoxin [Desulfobacteraceae bacterium]|nr:MAG: ferridoxin [Desulfobacteraceae bacterium]